jgi:LysM repeat protein
MKCKLVLPVYFCHMITCRVKSLLLVLVLTLVSPLMIYAQKRMTAEEYIQMYKVAAVNDMKKTGVPASITLAQGMYESDCGNSPLAKNANNHFGIKCHKEWTGPTYHQDDDAANECFRVYDQVQESYDDHSYFLRSRERYSSLFKLKVNDYKGWAHGLKKAGYATNPHYASKLIELIERYKLNEYDKGEVDVPPPNFASANKEVPSDVKTKNVEEKPATSAPSLSKNTVKSSPVLTSEKTINEVPFIRAKKGDTWLRIATANQLELWQILEYNEVEKNTILHENDIVFLKPKKSKCEQTFHIVQNGETVHSISQLYGVRASKLYQRNHLTAGKEPVPGSKLYLKLNKSFYE